MKIFISHQYDNLYLQIMSESIEYTHNNTIDMVVR